MTQRKEIMDLPCHLMTAFSIYYKRLGVATGTFPHTSSAGLISLDFV